MTELCFKCHVGPALVTGSILCFLVGSYLWLEMVAMARLVDLYGWYGLVWFMHHSGQPRYIVISSAFLSYRYGIMGKWLLYKGNIYIGMGSGRQGLISCSRHVSVKRIIDKDPAGFTLVSSSSHARILHELQPQVVGKLMDFQENQISRCDMDFWWQRDNFSLSLWIQLYSNTRIYLLDECSR